MKALNFLKAKGAYLIAAILLLIYPLLADILPGPVEEIISVLDAIIMILKVFQKTSDPKK